MASDGESSREPTSSMPSQELSSRSRAHDPTSSMATQGGGVRFSANSDDHDAQPAPSGPSHATIGAKPKSTNSPAASSGCCCLRRRGAAVQKKGGFKQTFVILRHSERKDYMDPNYKTSEEGLAWPHDAPLTVAGVKLAQEVAAELADVHAKVNFVSIAVSPYRRCMETAAEVAKCLNLPVVIDQEIGEVRDRTMPEDHVAHRSPTELTAMAKSLDMKVINPVLAEGGVKLFGKAPTWPESLEDAKNRYVVRMETYIRKCAEENQNMIIVTHADAVCAGLEMFERGGADVQNMGFCARVIASRDVKEKNNGEQEHGVFAAQWVVEAKAVGAEILKEEGAMGKYYEKLYIEKCDETQEMVTKRKNKRTKTDMMFDNAMKEVKNMTEEEEEEEDDEEDEAAINAKKNAEANRQLKGEDQV